MPQSNWNSITYCQDKSATLIGITDEKYAATIRDKQKLIESREEEITFGALVESIRDVLRFLRKNSMTGKNNDKTALGLVQPGGFIGNCYNCGKCVHKSFECLPKGTQSSSGKTCEECGIMGHLPEDCWENPKNKGKRCKTWVSRKKRKTREATGSHLDNFSIS